MFESQLSVQRPRLMELLNFARENVPYYMNIIPENVDDLTLSIKNWQEFPILDKRQIQSDWTSFLSDANAVNDPKVTIRSTSGSTGTPLKVARMEDELLFQAVRIWSARSRRCPGIFNMKVLSLDPYRGQDVPNILHFTRDGYVDFSVKAISGYIDKIKEFKPDWIYGFSTVVYRFAQYCKKEKIKIPALKMIEVTGEQLFPNQRTLIEKVFECPVVNQYGCQEVDFLSYECPHGSMHAWTNHLLFEVVRNDEVVPAGTPGELVVTSLTNKLMPLIRYRLGDIVTMEPSHCPCGDKRPILTPIGGRIGTLITTRKKTVSSSVLKRLFDEFMGEHEREIFEYQVVQTNYDNMDIYIVPGEQLNVRSTSEKLLERVNRLFPEVASHIIVTDSINVSPSGKTKRFIPYIPADDMSDFDYKFVIE